MSWRDEEYTDMERGLKKEVNRLRSVVRSLEEENAKLKQDVSNKDSADEAYNKAIDDFAKVLKNNFENYIDTIATQIKNQIKF